MSPAHLTDAQIAARALDGDRAAFAELFARHEGGLFNVAYRMTGSREDAADVTQEAFLRVFARLDDLAGREVNLAAYLHRTARNLVHDRSAQRARETPVDEMERVAGADPALDADPQLTTLVRSQGDEVRAANARLPERHRLALALRELEGMGYDDIGRVLDITPGAVAQLLARARLGLRRELRLRQVDLEAMDPACRGRLGEIAALIDGELDVDRAHVLERHLALCPSCRAAREAFREAGRRYRAWLPLPLLLGLGADTARAAEARRLVRFSDGAARGAGGGGGAAAGGLLGSRRRAAGVVGAGVLSLALVVAVPALVATRSGSGGAGPSPVPPAAAAPATTTAAATTATSTPSTAPAPRPTTGATTAAPAAAASPAGVPVVAPAAPGTTTAAAPAPATTTRATIAPRPRPRPATPAPTVTSADDPATPATTAAPAPPEPPPADPPARSDAPPATSDPSEPAPGDPPTTSTPTRTTPPDIPFPTTFTSARPPVVVP